MMKHRTVRALLASRHGITADTALRLAWNFSGDAYSWLNLQQAHDLKMTEQVAMAKIAAEVQPREAEHPTP